MRLNYLVSRASRSLWACPSLLGQYHPYLKSPGALPFWLTEVPTLWSLICKESLQPFLVGCRGHLAMQCCWGFFLQLDWNNPAGLFLKKLKWIWHLLILLCLMSQGHRCYSFYFNNLLQNREEMVSVAVWWRGYGLCDYECKSVLTHMLPKTKPVW